MRAAVAASAALANPALAVASVLDWRRHVVRIQTVAVVHDAASPNICSTTARQKQSTVQVPVVWTSDTVAVRTRVAALETARVQSALLRSRVHPAPRMLTAAMEIVNRAPHRMAVRFAAKLQVKRAPHPATAALVHARVIYAHLRDRVVRALVILTVPVVTARSVSPVATVHAAPHASSVDQRAILLPTAARVFAVGAYAKATEEVVDTYYYSFYLLKFLTVVVVINCSI